MPNSNDDNGNRTDLSARLYKCTWIKRIPPGFANRDKEWYDRSNPLLGDQSPNEMIENGQSKRLEKVIDNWLKGEMP